MKLKYTKHIKEDFTGSLFLFITAVKTKLIRIVCSFQSILIKVKGCRLGSGTWFTGRVIVRRYPCSTIQIGDRCQFVSSSEGNNRGISHACVLATGKPDAKIIIGNECGFSGCSIVCDREVHIGNKVTIGADTRIGDRDDHPELYASEPKPVIIDDNVWIGMNCIILKGVHIGHNVIIGAGSVVTKDIPADSVAAGVPCHVIKKKQ